MCPHSLKRCFILGCCMHMNQGQVKFLLFGFSYKFDIVRNVFFQTSKVDLAITYLSLQWSGVLGFSYKNVAFLGPDKQTVSGHMYTYC